jgi:hypothetical protein
MGYIKGKEIAAAYKLIYRVEINVIRIYIKTAGIFTF